MKSTRDWCARSGWVTHEGHNHTIGFGRHLGITLLSVLVLLSGTGWAQTPSFQGLGQLPGTQGTYAQGVSGDGSVVVGYFYDVSLRTHAFRWTISGGVEDLGTLGGLSSEAYGVSSDGSVVVGRAANFNGGLRAFRWTAAGGMQDIGTAASFSYSDASKVSSDGSVVVGLQGQAYRWTAAGGMQTLGALASGAYSTALGVSRDGVVAVGYSYNAAGQGRAYRCTTVTGMTDLGTLGGTEGIAHAASGNGAVVVGESRDKNAFWRAFRWTSSGLQNLGTLGGPMAAANDVSSDGSIVVGKSLTSSLTSSNRAFRWSAKKGMQDLRQALLSAGVTSVQNWTLFTATGVSADGKTMVGYGLNPSKQWESFRAVLPLPQ